MRTATQEGGAAQAPANLKGLFGELGDLKRVRSAGRDGSIASRLFRSAWGDLAAGRDPRAVALAVTAAALAAARLGDIDGELLAAVGLPAEDAAPILQNAIEDVAGGLDGSLRAELAFAVGRERVPSSASPPAFVEALERQPRAGVTCPGQPRVLLQPPENHAEHCLAVAIYGVLLSPVYGADIATVFLAGLSHHFHNAGLPDSGFSGEMLLGKHLTTVMDHFTDAALSHLAPPLRDEVLRARRILSDAGTPEGRAFHAADVIDRVLEIGQHLRAASLTMEQVLCDMALGHEGPVKPFHDRVLREMALP